MERAPGLSARRPQHCRDRGDGAEPAGMTAEAAAAARPSTFGALRHPNYRVFWVSQGLAVMGQTMDFVALGWLVYQMTGSAVSLGITGLAQALPRVGLTLVGGASADRIDRRKLPVAVQGTVGALYPGLA